MIITVDCRWIDSSGIGVYIRGCLPFFLDSDNQFRLIGDPRKLQPIISGRNNALILDCRLKPFSIRELLFFPRKLLLKINSSDLYYSPFFSIPGGVKVPVYTTIHDIVFPDMPELTSRLGLAARMFFFRRCYRRSTKIFTVSAFSKSRIEYHLGRKKPIIVTHSAIRPGIPQPETGVISKKETIVFIGNIKKHKGLDCLLEALTLARAGGLPHRLIIMGCRDNFRTSDNDFLGKVDSLDSGAVTFTGFVSDEELAEYLSSASLLVQPSLYEGFGLPPLEAMVLGTQALISDIPVFREIYEGFPVIYFRSGDAHDLKNKMMELLFNKKPQSLVLPHELLSRYTFEKTADRILKELE
jgi:glycosyltransferase involved in cell wall biosynthesis